MIFVDTPPFPDPEPRKGRTQQEEITRIENAIAEWLDKRYSRESGFISIKFPEKTIFTVLVANPFGSTVYSTCIKSTKIA
jgi:hypothetical protein